MTSLDESFPEPIFDTHLFRCAMVDNGSSIHNYKFIARLEQCGSMGDQDDQFLFAQRLDAPVEYFLGYFIVN